MTIWRSYSLLVVVFAAAWTYACGDEDKPTVAERTCKQVCAKFEQCSDETDVSGCESDCASAGFRSDAFFSTQARCADQLACNKLVTTGGDSLCNGAADCPLWDCVRDQLDVQPSEEQHDVCKEIGNKVEDCEPTIDDDVAEEQCLDAVVTMSDAYTQASQECFREACSGIVDCLDGLADDYDANVRIFSGDFQ
jgi:hypothetical protein